MGLIDLLSEYVFDDVADPKPARGEHGYFDAMCYRCGETLVGLSPIPYASAPVGPNEHIPDDPSHPLYDEEVGYLVCPECGREIPLTPREWHNPPKWV